MAGMLVSGDYRSLGRKADTILLVQAGYLSSPHYFMKRCGSVGHITRTRFPTCNPERVVAIRTKRVVGVVTLERLSV